MKRYCILILIFIVLFLCSHVAYSRDQVPQADAIYINTGFKEPMSTILDQLTHELFRRMAMKTHFQEMPAERSLQMVERGVDDMECCRIPAVVARAYPELISVPESLYNVTFSAFIVDSEISIRDWTDLKPYNVGTVRGYKLAVNKATEVEPLSLIVVDKVDSLFHMLNKGRIEVGVMSQEDGLEVISKLGYSDIQLLEPPLAQLPLHLMLHKKHQDLAGRLSKVILEMKQDGTVERIVNDVLAPLKR